MEAQAQDKPVRRQISGDRDGGRSRDNPFATAHPNNIDTAIGYDQLLSGLGRWAEAIVEPHARNVIFQGCVRVEFSVFPHRYMVPSAARKDSAVHAERIETLPRPRDELRELLRLLSSYRWRLGAESLLRFSSRGLIVGGLAFALASALRWLLGLALSPLWLAAVLIAPPILAIVVALASWPSHRQTAWTADRRLRLDERVATAVELASPHRRSVVGRFDRMQVRDAVDHLRLAPRTWTADVIGGRDRLLLLLVGALATLTLLLPLLPRPSFERPAEVAGAPDTGATFEDRVFPMEILDAPVAPAVAEEQPMSETDLAPRVRAAQAEQEALDRLAQALGQISAGKGVAEAIQRGDFADARNQLSSLAEEADQLSDAAKKELSKALQTAASASGADRQLADRERQAAQALSKNNYADQRQALRQLADQVERSGSRSLPASQLARDVGRLQQEQASGGQQGSPTNQGAPTNGVQSQQGAGLNGAQGSQSSGGAAEGAHGGPGAGTGSTEGVGDPAGRLADSGQLVEVPTKLSSGSAERPLSGNEDQVGNNPGMSGRSVIEAAQTQHTGQLTPEQNLVPSEQRPVVRGYFR
jgi:hypothetical protein